VVGTRSPRAVILVESSATSPPTAARPSARCGSRRSKAGVCAASGNSRRARPGSSVPSWTRASRSGGPIRGPGFVVWPEDVVALSVPLHESRDAAHLAALARYLDATVLAGVTTTEPHGDVPQRDRRVEPRRARRLGVRKGPSGAVRGVRPIPRLVLTPGQPRCGATRRHPRPRQRPDANPSRAARDPRLLRGLLRRPRPLVGAGRSPAAGGPDQHVVVLE